MKPGKRKISRALISVFDKTGLLDFEVVTEMVERGMLDKPESLFDTSYTTSGDKVLDFIVNSIK